VACATLLVGLTLIAETFGALKVSTTRPEAGLGADCDSLFRHIVPPRSGLESRTACLEARRPAFSKEILKCDGWVGEITPLLYFSRLLAGDDARGPSGTAPHGVEEPRIADL